MKIDSAEFILSALSSRQFVRDGLPQVAFVGRSNVGKSSLMNRLLGRKGLARTSSTPGRTRAVNYFLINRRFYFVDLPGYGYAKAAKSDRKSWAALMDRYFQSALPQTLVTLLVDGKVGATPLDIQASDYLRSLGAEMVVTATKIDRLSRSRRSATLAEIRRTLELQEEDRVIGVSSETGDGIKELWRGIHLRFEAGKQSGA